MTDIRFIKGDARKLPIEDESVQCIVTSPPYWGLRKYAGEQEVDWSDGRFAYGLEPTIEMYVSHTVEVLREMRRVLRKDGVLFLNIGDSYAAGKMKDDFSGTNGLCKFPSDGWSNAQSSVRAPGLKPKDLCLIPSRVAIAAQADGWWVRSMIVWAKPNPMPESCKDRPTDAYEYIIMLTKAERYFWDFDAVKEPCTGNAHPRGDGLNPKCFNGSSFEKGKTAEAYPNMGKGPRKTIKMPDGWDTKRGAHGTIHREGREKGKIKQNPSFSNSVTEVVEARNIRNLWQFPTQPFGEAHFATFPEELPRRCILAATRVGDTVLDPFAGSGTVGRVAIELNRKAILNDLAYHDLSEKRTRNVQRRLIQS